MCLCSGVKNRSVFVKSVFINVGKGISKLGRWIAAKHATKLSFQLRQQYSENKFHVLNEFETCFCQ